jgi:4-amino-4-deoxy-L-arabinose transferase-like glycosyltransferase
MAVGISSIPMMYLIGRKFFDQRYSLVVASLFAFEPHLNYNSTLGMSEPILILAVIGAFYFILNQNTRFIIISLIMAGIVYWIRINGFWVFVVISIIYFLTQKKSRKFLANYGIAIAVFLLVISPVLIERNEEFGDPFYSVYKDTIFAGSYELMLKAQVDNEKISAFDYIENYGILSFVNNYILIGIYNTLVVTARLTLPYLFILIPFGILFSFRAFDQKSNFIKANWIFILTSMGFLIFIMAIIPEKRFVLYLLPFLMIFSVIPIQRVVEYGLDTFSFSRKQKDFFLIGVLITIIIVSSILIIRYAPDSELEAEKLEFSKYALNNLHGVTLQDREGSLDYVGYLLLSESTENRKINSSIIQNTYKQFEDTNGPIGTNIEELIADGKNYNLKYIISNETPGFLHPFTDALYYNYEQYPYLKKIFDSSNQGFEKLKVKVFEIDYEKFNKLLNE